MKTGHFQANSEDPVGQHRAAGRLLSHPESNRRSLKTELLPPSSGYELPTTFIRGK